MSELCQCMCVFVGLRFVDFSLPCLSLSRDDIIVRRSNSNLFSYLWLCRLTTWESWSSIADVKIWFWITHDVWNDRKVMAKERNSQNACPSFFLSCGINHQRICRTFHVRWEWRQVKCVWKTGRENGIDILCIVYYVVYVSLPISVSGKMTGRRKERHEMRWRKQCSDQKTVLKRETLLPCSKIPSFLLIILHDKHTTYLPFICVCKKVYVGGVRKLPTNTFLGDEMKEDWTYGEKKDAHTQYPIQKEQHASLALQGTHQTSYILSMLFFLLLIPFPFLCESRKFSSFSSLASMVRATPQENCSTSIEKTFLPSFNYTLITGEKVLNVYVSGWWWAGGLKTDIVGRENIAGGNTWWVKEVNGKERKRVLSFFDLIHLSPCVLLSCVTVFPWKASSPSVEWNPFRLSFFVLLIIFSVLLSFSLTGIHCHSSAHRPLSRFQLSIWWSMRLWLADPFVQPTWMSMSWYLPSWQNDWCRRKCPRLWIRWTNILERVWSLFGFL